MSESLAARLHLAPGDHLDAVSYTPAQLELLFAGKASAADRGEGPALRFRVVGIGREPSDLGAVCGVLGVTAVLAYTTSVDRLVTTPRLYGSMWDFSAADHVSQGNSCGPDDLGPARGSGDQRPRRGLLQRRQRFVWTDARSAAWASPP